MKRIGGLWEQLVSFPHLLRSAKKALRGKRNRPSASTFLFNLEPELFRLQREIQDRSYTPGEYLTFEIREPKPRLISAAPFRDRVVHHALTGILEPIFDPTLIHDCYACRRGKGTHAAVLRFNQFARCWDHVLHCDVSKYFPSLDHQRLKELLARKIKDKGVLWLAGTIIDHSNPQEPVQDWFPGDDLFTGLERRIGLPLGNQTSQFFANLYLSPLDHFVKERLRVRGYLRYVDDFCLFSDSTQVLATWREACRTFLEDWRLTLHPRKAVISRVADGTRFLGYRIFPTHRLLPRGNVVRMRRRLRSLQHRHAAGQITDTEVRRSVAGWLGHALLADSFELRERMFSSVNFS